MRFIWSATFAAALGGALVPAPAYPQVRSRSPRAGTTLAVQPGRSISDVTGKPFNSAIDALAWTHLPIVQTESVTTSVARGVVVAQRPRAGTPVTATRVETLVVATPPRRAPIGVLAGRIVGGTGAPPSTSVPPPAPGARDVGPTRATTVTVPGVSVAVPGVVVQDDTRVPDLYGRAPDMVAALIKRSRLVPDRALSEYSDIMASGLVFRQKPEPRTVVPVGTKVLAWYSMGPHPVQQTLRVPTVLGLSLATATDTLRRAGLRVGRIDTVARADGDGTVSHQDPPAGAAAHVRDAVALSIVVAPPRVQVPSIIGLSRLAATATLDRAGLRVGTVTLVSMKGRDTVIVAQQPDSNATVDAHSFIDLVENRPPVVRRVPVPNLVGLTRTDAERRLARDSLTLGDVLMPSDAAAATVAAQRPNAGESVYVHSRVNVRLQQATPIDTAQTERFIRVPDVVSLTVAVARRTLIDSGFSRFALGGTSVTAASVVDSQFPDAGTLVRPTARIALFSRRVPSRPVPDLRGRREIDARAVAEADQFVLTVLARHRGLRLRDAVTFQDPAPPATARPDGTINVELTIPLMPLPAAVLAMGVVAAAGAGIRRKTKPNKLHPPTVDLELQTPQSDPPSVRSTGPDTLIRTSLALRYDVEAEPCRLRSDQASLIRSETRRDD